MQHPDYPIHIDYVKIINGERRSGRTTRLVEYAIENNLVLVSGNKSHVEDIKKIRDSLLSSGIIVAPKPTNEQIDMANFCAILDGDKTVPPVIAYQYLVGEDWRKSFTRSDRFVVSDTGLAIDDFDIWACGFLTMGNLARSLSIKAVTICCNIEYTQLPQTKG